MYYLLQKDAIGYWLMAFNTSGKYSEVYMQISFELTKDPLLLEEYYRIREQCYRQELKLPSFDGSEEPADCRGNIFVIKNNNHCLGGARIVGNTQALGLDLSLVDLMAGQGLESGSCCMWERLAVSHTLRGSNRRSEFCEQLVRASRSLGYEYAFMVSSIRNARLYRLCYSALSIPFQILNHVKCTPKGDFSQLEHVLSVAHLRTGHQPGIAHENGYSWAPEQQLSYSVAA
ncbi:MAG: hypothetical protein COA46_08090 [Porticoccaceae bacterium]|nr:MAG: hypothetical protein COA46_08090 [Porticoccaceae bacterium]